MSKQFSHDVSGFFLVLRGFRGSGGFGCRVLFGVQVGKKTILTPSRKMLKKTAEKLKFGQNEVKSKKGSGRIPRSEQNGKKCKCGFGRATKNLL